MELINARQEPQTSYMKQSAQSDLIILLVSLMRPTKSPLEAAAAGVGAGAGPGAVRSAGLGHGLSARPHPSARLRRCVSLKEKKKNPKLLAFTMKIKTLSFLLIIHYRESFVFPKI